MKRPDLKVDYFPIIASFIVFCFLLYKSKLPSYVKPLKIQTLNFTCIF